MKHTSLSERALGKWPNILPALGIDRRFLTGKHGPCPTCGGKDRFRFDNKKGRGDYFCSQCGPGDGVKLLMNVKGWDFREAAQHVEEIIGKVEPVKVKIDRTEDEKRAAMNTLWQSSGKVEKSDPVYNYLLNRVGELTVPSCLRYATKVLYQDEIKSWYPAMIAMVTAPDGRPSILHRTYLTLDGRKAPVESPRRMMPGKIDKGAAVRLMPAGRVLGIAEGIETAFAASKLFEVPVWSAINSELLAQWEPPQGVEEVIVFGDNDPKFAGQAAAFNLAKRLTTQRQIKTRVELPQITGQDWNDVLNEWRGA
jgi:putative DNA primase/helicase